MDDPYEHIPHGEIPFTTPGSSASGENAYCSGKCSMSEICSSHWVMCQRLSYVYFTAGQDDIKEEDNKKGVQEEETTDDSRQVMILSESLRELVNNEMFRSIRRHFPLVLK